MTGSRAVSRRQVAGLLLAAGWPALSRSAGPGKQLAPGISFVEGAANGLLVERSGKILLVYGDPRPEAPPAALVLFTHHRREAVCCGTAAARRGASAIVPAAERALFEDAEGTWRTFHDKTWRHDYAVQATKFPVASIPVARAVREADRIDWEGLSVEVLDTPGYTRGAVSYLFDTPENRIACTGDLIYGQGQILDIYSLQDAVPEIKLREYHGYASRIADVIASLRKIAARKPDVLVPAHGPLIEQPREAIDALIRRLQDLFANYLYTDAGRHYFGAESIRFRAQRILGARPYEHMPPAEIVSPAPPAWMRPVANSRIVCSTSGAALLVDCGPRKVREEVRRLLSEGVIARVEGIHITHYHDDHTDNVEAASEEFHCPVYTNREMRDILAAPFRFRMPCLTDAPIRRLEVWKEGETRLWHEFRVTRYYFPGQTLYHDAILVERDGGERVLLAGDSFTPTGMDDYCLLNRNLLAPGRGYLRCLDLLERLRPDLLVNQHVGLTFRFSPDQLALMRRSLERRIAILKELLPWDDPNFGLDEQWARFDPYGLEAAPGKTVEMSVAILNHSPAAQAFTVTPHLPPDWAPAPRPILVKAPPRSEASARFRFRIPPASRGLHVITADVRFGPWDLRDWIEALIQVRA